MPGYNFLGVCTYNNQEYTLSGTATYNELDLTISPPQGLPYKEVTKIQPQGSLTRAQLLKLVEIATAHTLECAPRDLVVGEFRVAPLD